MGFGWVCCPECGHKLFWLNTADRMMLEIKCHSCKTMVVVRSQGEQTTIAANEVLGLGAGRAVKFRKAYIDTINEIGRMLAIDGKDDADLTYSTAKIDERLRKIVGDENFVDWDGRYGR